MGALALAEATTGGGGERTFGGISDSLPGGPDDPFFGGAASADHDRVMEAQEREWERSRAQNIQRFGEAEERLSPWMGAEAQAREAFAGELGLGPTEFSGEAYKQTPGYANMMESSRRGAESAGYGSDRRMQAAATPSAATNNSHYANYMNKLSSLSTPKTSTNVSSLGAGQAATLGDQSGNLYGSMSAQNLNAGIGQQNQMRDIAGSGMQMWGDSMTAGPSNKAYGTGASMMDLYGGM